MRAYFHPIVMGITIFCFILYFSFIPYIVYQYRKNGEIHKNEMFVKYSFVLYVLTAYLVVILPLPSIEYVANLTSSKYNIIPFQFVRSFLKESGFNIRSFSTYIPALKSPSFYTVLFNLFLFLPLGVYAKKYFKLSIIKTIVAAFLLSLFFELTQLSGLYFIYPRPYRLFDVDDLIINTLGAVFGYFLELRIDRLLPTIETKRSMKNLRVSIFRRLISFLLDIILLNLISYMAFKLINNLFNISKFEILFIDMVYLFYFIFLYYFLGGRSIGKILVKIKTVDKNLESPSFLQILIRNGLFLFGIRFGFKFINLVSTDRAITYPIAYMIAFILLFSFYINIFIQSIRKKPYFYEQVSKTKDISLN